MTNIAIDDLDERNGLAFDNGWAHAASELRANPPRILSDIWMTRIMEHSVTVPLTAAQAYVLFTEHLARWWPREYTWGQGALQTIGIEPRLDGLCSEYGPHGFRSDWGRVLVWEPPQRLALAWQISPRREPEPDPDRASTLGVRFDEQEPGRTVIRLTHRDFERHGSGAEEYRAALAAPAGWPYILQRFREAAT